MIENQRVKGKNACGRLGGGGERVVRTKEKLLNIKYKFKMKMYCSACFCIKHSCD